MYGEPIFTIIIKTTNFITMKKITQNLRWFVTLLTMIVCTGAWAENDVLNLAFTGVTGTHYKEFSGKVGASGAVYAGQCAGRNSSIQLRTNNNNSGIVTTTSGGKVREITNAWNSNTASGRGIDLVHVQKTGDVVSPPVTLNIGTIGYATLYYSDRALVVPAGVEAYTYTVTEGGAAYSTIYSEGEVIPAGEAVVIYMQGGGVAIFEVSSENPDKSIDNMLKGYDMDHLTEGGDYYYALSINAAWDESTIGFYWMEDNGDAFQCWAHKAYLALDRTFVENNGGSVKRFYGFGNSTTAIQGIDMNASTKDAVIYNLAGQRVSAPVKGNMYIVNGKKVMMK